MKKNFLLFLILINSISLVLCASLPTGFIEKRLATDLNPTNITLDPDGRVIICEKNGNIRIIKNGTLLGTSFLKINGVDSYNERGLETLVFDPDFATQPYVYVYYTTTINGTHNRISRFEVIGDTAKSSSEQVILELDNFTGGVHNGGQLLFKQDKTLIITTGDHQNAKNAQRFTSLHGKILRINRDGSIPEDNPFYNSLSGKYRSIYALGFRNPFKASIQAGTGKIFINDVGNSTWEEINELISGKNYGWPLIEGKRTTQNPPSDYLDPIFVYNHNDGCCITGSTFFNPNTTAFPQKFIGKYFYADYCNGYIRYIDSSNPTTFSGFATNINRCIDLETDLKTGNIYYLARGGLGGGSVEDNTSSNSGEVWKIEYNGRSEVSISVQPQSMIVSENSNAQFVIGANGTQPIYFQWQKNNRNILGASTSGLNLENIKLSDNLTIYKVLVYNNLSTITSNIATLTVIHNFLPNATITSPLSNFLYTAGTTLTFSGLAIDPEDGVLSASNFNWKIDLHHNAHSHPATEQIFGIKSGIYEIPSVGETDSNVWLRIYLTVYDSENESKTIYRDVYPKKSLVKLNSNPQGLSLKLDGSTVIAPYTFIGVSGMERSLETEVFQSDENKNYTFTGWGENKNPQIKIITPSSDSTITASFNNSIKTSIDNYEISSNNIKIYPNPSHDKFYITGLNLFKYQIFSLAGELIHSGGETNEIDLYKYSNGIYFIKIIPLNSKSSFINKILIKQ